MGGINVKNTIVERVLQIVAPHPCSGCGKVGSVLCHDCKNDITNEPFAGCILCGTPQSSGICYGHRSPISRAFVVGKRTAALETSINRLKFHNTKAAAGVLAELLDDSLPLLPTELAIIPIPTVRSHIRQRGYDQVEIIARGFSQRRTIPLLPVLYRKTNTTQHTVGRSKRQAQAATTFGLIAPDTVKGKTILLIDDIVTTGSTLQAAASLLVDAGATVWVAALAYQPLD